MAAIDRVGGGVVHHHQFAVAADLVADGGLDLQLAAGRQPEIDGVENAAGDPTILTYPRHGGEAHAGRAAHDLLEIVRTAAMRCTAATSAANGPTSLIPAPSTPRAATTCRWNEKRIQPFVESDEREIL